jgi:hypothetical protein
MLKMSWNYMTNFYKLIYVCVFQSEIVPKWSGWIDKLSGIKRYVFEVWKMEYSFDYKGLREPDITSTVNPVPVFIEEVNNAHPSPLRFPTFKPNEPGVYSAILEVNDQANNSKYARRLAIFDSTSQITMSNTSRLYASSASQDTNYSWITTLENELMTVLWKNHFVNEVHEKGHFLAKVLDYTPRLSDGVNKNDYKIILSGFDDNDGVRNKSTIHNINSIVRFETRHGKPSSAIPTAGWVHVNPLRESYNFTLKGIQFVDGDSHQFWVRAYDIMGNRQVDSTVVHFDTSKPTIYPPEIKLNIDNGKFPFSSRYDTVLL